MLKTEPSAVFGGQYLCSYFSKMMSLIETDALPRVVRILNSLLCIYSWTCLFLTLITLNRPITKWPPHLPLQRLARRTQSFVERFGARVGQSYMWRCTAPCAQCPQEYVQRYDVYRETALTEVKTKMCFLWRKPNHNHLKSNVTPPAYSKTIPNTLTTVTSMADILILCTCVINRNIK